MRKTMLLAAMLSLTALMFAAAPAMALDRDDRNNHRSVSHTVEQETDSGDGDQSFEVSGTGDNSNQTVGIQGTANTGNAQNQISVVQNGSEAEDFSFEDSGASIEVSPSNSTSCEQEVNQAASAYHHGW